MALTQEFVQAVSQKNNLRAKIMLKDSLLVDTSFNQFNEMLNYAESRLQNFWVSDEEDDEILSSDSQELNAILVGLVNNFSHRRVNHLMSMIHKMYPPKSQNFSQHGRESAVIIPKTKMVLQEYKEINRDRRVMAEVIHRIQRKNQIDTKDLEEIREAAKSIVVRCNKMSTRK